MIFIYIFLVLMAAFPLVLTIVRMRRGAFIKKNGIYTDAFVIHKNTIRIKHSSFDKLTLEYKDRAVGRSYHAKATAATGTHRIGDRITIAYLPSKPSQYVVADTKKGYLAMLIFSILLFLFVLFAIYKINEMVKTGQA